MKPAFPTVVYLMPNCWKLLARQRQMPQEIPPMIRSLRLCWPDVVLCDETEPEFFCPRTRISGTSTADQIRERTALEVKPPT